MPFDVPLHAGALPEASTTRLADAPLRPIHDRVLVQRQPDATVSAAGLVLPFAHSDDVQVATVVAVGKDVRECKRGDRVLHVRVVGVKHKTDAGLFAVMKESEILGVLEGERESTGECPHCGADCVMVGR